MILYFSGTGNSRYLSEVLNSEIKDEIISINDCLKTKKKYSFTSKNHMLLFVLHMHGKYLESLKALLKRQILKEIKKYILF